MSKYENKSIVDLIGKKPLSRKPSAEEIDDITSKIHKPESQISQKQQAEALVKKNKKISLSTSIPLYLKAKTKATIQGQTLMAYVIGLIEADVITGNN